MPSVRSGFGQDVLPKIQEALPDIREWSGGPLEGHGLVGRPSQRSGRGRGTLPKVREALPDVREFLRGTPRGPGVVEGPP